MKISFSTLVLEIRYRYPKDIPFMPHPLLIEEIKFKEVEEAGAMMKLRNHTGRLLKVSKRSQRGRCFQQRKWIKMHVICQVFRKHW